MQWEGYDTFNRTIEELAFALTRRTFTKKDNEEENTTKCNYD